MKKIIQVMTVVFAFSLFAVAAYAEEMKDQSAYNPWGGVFGPSMSSQRSFADRATTIIGKEVQNRQGDSLGKITDLMVDPEDGRIAFAVLSHGGVLGIPTRFVAVPFSALTPSHEKNAFLLDASKEQIAAAVSFGRNNWPDVTNREWAAETYRHYGQAPYWEAGEGCGP